MSVRQTRSRIIRVDRRNNREVVEMAEMTEMLMGKELLGGEAR